MSIIANPFKKALRSNRKLRAAFDGVSGSGKSFTAMRLAQAMKKLGIVKKIAVIDTEKESMSLYAGECPAEGDTPWEFDTLNLKQHSPQQFTASVKSAVANGYDMIIIDSWSHAWMGKDGVLDTVDKKGGRFTDWKDVSPMIREMVDTITGCDAHIIVTMRCKTDWVIEKEINKKGQEVSVPRKIGMAPVQKEGMEYEFDIYGSMDLSHQMKIGKSRCSPMQDATAIKPDDSFWMPMFEWLGMIEANTIAQKEEAKGQPEQPKHVLEETADETTERLMNMSASAENLEQLNGMVIAIKNETGKLDKETVEKVRKFFGAKRTELTEAAEAALKAASQTPHSEQQPTTPAEQTPTNEQPKTAL